jgi:hypothetical protein
MDFPSFITDAKLTFDFLNFDEGTDYRRSSPDLEEIPAWKNFPDKKYEVIEDGKVIVKANKKSDFNSIVRYISFFYDKKSPFHKNFNNIAVKKQKAIEFSGIDEKLLKHDEIIEMIVGFLLHQNNKLWAVIMTNENLFLEYMQVLNTKLENFNSDKDIVETLTKKEKVRGFFETLCSDLDVQYNRFYNGDKDLQEEIQKKKRFTPESISKKLSQ